MAHYIAAAAAAVSLLFYALGHTLLPAMLALQHVPALAFHP